MDSVQGFGHYEDPFLYNKNETWTNQAQQKEVERLLQLQQLAILQRERASMYQQSKIFFFLFKIKLIINFFFFFF